MGKYFQGNVEKFFWWPSFVEDRKTGKKKFFWLVSKQVGKIKVTEKALIPEIGLVDTYRYDYVLNYSGLSVKEVERNEVDRLAKNRERLVSNIEKKQKELKEMIDSLASGNY